MEKNDDLFKFNCNAFQAATFEGANNFQQDDWSFSIHQKLSVALYFTSIAYNFDINNLPKVDRTIFSKIKFAY